MNILVSTDSCYLRITETMLFSLSQHCSRPLSVWCMQGRLSEKEKADFQHYLKGKCGIRDFHWVDMFDLKGTEASFPLTIRHISLETYYRLFAQFVLPQEMDRVLWLDSDIIVKDAIDELYDQEIQGVPLLAFPNMGEAAVGGNAERLGLPGNCKYFNAGVMLLNLDYLRKGLSKEQVISFCLQNAGSFKQQDQDALNLLYGEKARVMDDQRFNCMVNAPSAFSAPDIVQRASIIHYAGWQKPWKIKWQSPYSFYWWDVRKAEGLTVRDYVILQVGSIWRFLGINTIEKWLCAPYHWIEARMKKSR